MTTEIRTNGSHFAGEVVDSIESLIEMLKTHPLRRNQEPFFDEKPVWVNFMSWNDVDETTGELLKCYQASEEQPAPGLWSFSGNFFDYNHPFDVYSDYEELTEKLKALILRNMQRADYLSQEPSPKTAFFVVYPSGRKDKVTL